MGTNPLYDVRPILPKQVEAHPGFLKLKPQYRVPLLRFASLADPATRQVSGDATEIALQIGLKHWRRLYDLIDRWNKAGLVTKGRQRREIDPETRRTTFLAGSCWQLLPEPEMAQSEKSAITVRARACAEPAPRAEPAPEPAPRAACLPSVSSAGSAVGEEQEQAGRADARVAWLEQHLGGTISGSARSALVAALSENEDGVKACYREAKERGTNPLRLFLHMISEGDWRNKQTEPRRFASPQEEPIAPSLCPTPEQMRIRELRRQGLNPNVVSTNVRGGTDG